LVLIPISIPILKLEPIIIWNSRTISRIKLTIFGGVKNVTKTKLTIFGGMKNSHKSGLIVLMPTWAILILRCR
jgi:hypothetical protein